MKIYLPFRIDIVTSLTLHGPVVVDDSSSIVIVTSGCFGSGSVILSLLSMAPTFDMVGRSAAFSCTHNSAMLTHLIISKT